MWIVAAVVKNPRSEPAKEDDMEKNRQEGLEIVSLIKEAENDRKMAKRIKKERKKSDRKRKVRYAYVYLLFSFF